MGDSQINFYNRGLAYQAIENFENAVRDYSVVLRLDDSNIDAFISRSNMYYEMGKYEVSILDYAEAIYLSPESPALYFNRGISYYSNKQFDEAVNDFTEVLRYDSTDVNALWYAALSYKELSDEGNAIQCYDKVKALNPAYKHLWSIDKNRLILKKFIKENWIYTLAIVLLLLASLFFVLRIVKNNKVTEID